VDTAEGVISAYPCVLCDGRDSQYLTNISHACPETPLKEKRLIMDDLLADQVYSNGPTTIFLEQKLHGIPVSGKYKPEIRRFPYQTKKRTDIQLPD